MTVEALLEICIVLNLPSEPLNSRSFISIQPLFDYVDY